MNDISTATSNVIPFKFGKQQVRTLLIDDQPWFVAADVCASLAIGNVSLAVNGRADRDTDGLDEDEKGIATVNTPSGAQEMLVVNESGLYALIFKSRKAEAKRFKKWVTAEVLPAIRKHGHYEDSKGVMTPMIDSLLGKAGALRLSNVIRCRVAKLDAEHQRSATAKLASAVHACFGVPRVELIPVNQFEAAANFVASYAIEGEYLPKQSQVLITLTNDQAMKIHHLAHHAAWVAHYWQTSIGPALKKVGSEIYSGCNEHLECVDRHRRFLDDELLPSIREQLNPSVMPGYGWGVLPESKAVAA